ncbi:MAG: hypothetical protein EBT61_21110 [Verrucomicrobia bacterium]|nr:hypothetical protein [Verrucomicrobiota bacterium]
MANYTKAEKAEAIARLREWLKPGDTVYTILEHVSSSGMSRAIRFVIPKVDEDGKPYFLHPNHAIGVVLGLRFHTSRGRQTDALHVTGCGMDMGFDCVYNLSRYLFPDGFKVDGRGRNGDTSGHDNDGGYALKQAWL